MSQPSGNPTTFNHLSEMDKGRILGYMNFTDLKHCRLVSKSWNIVVTCTESFRRGVFYVSLGHMNQSTLDGTTVKWNHIRLEIFDIVEADAPAKFWTSLPLHPFAYVQILEFKRCFISWRSFRKFVVLSTSLQQIIFDGSIFTENFADAKGYGLSAQQRHSFLGRTSSLRALTIIDVGDIEALTEVLEKMGAYQACCLETLKIEYKTTKRVPSHTAVRFLQILSELILCNKLTLRNLILNVRNTEILNHFVPFVFTPLENFYKDFQLRVFKIAQPLPEAENVSVTAESMQFLSKLVEFLRTQRYLVSLAFPHLGNLGAAESRRWYILDSTTKHLQKLRVPGAMYLRRNLWKIFHSLKVLFVGEHHLGSPASFLQPTKFNLDRGGTARQNVLKITAKLRVLSIHAHIVYESGNLFHVLEKLPNLTRFEFNGLRPLFNDKDVQAIIKHLPRLKHLGITHCHLITDAGLTGIPRATCRDLLRYSTIYIHDLKATKQLGTEGCPLSDLKGLLSLHLFGNAEITDVGIRFGIEFRHLRSIQLPYCPQITNWGFEQLGIQNPCLESIILAGATEETAIGLASLKTNHKRLVNTIVQNIEKLDGEVIQPTLLNGILWNVPSPPPPSESKLEAAIMKLL